MQTTEGVDVVDSTADAADMELLKHDIGDLPLESESVDIIMSRSVMEHVDNPEKVHREICRVLKPAGSFFFLTANYWDYASLIAKLVPNRFHPWIFARTEGRAEQDVFPVAYRTNTRYAVCKWAAASSFEVASFRYLGQYPAYLFNGFLFLLATGYEKLISNVPGLTFCRDGSWSDWRSRAWQLSVPRPVATILHSSLRSVLPAMFEQPARRAECQ